MSATICGKRFKQLMDTAAKLNGYHLQNIPAEVYSDALLMLSMDEKEIELFLAWRNHRNQPKDKQ